MSDRLPAVTKVLDRTTAVGNARLVLAAIASYAKTDGTEAWPSLESIRHRAGVRSVRTVRRRIAELVEAGELEVDYKAGRNGCNLYSVRCCAPGDLDTAMSTSDLDTAMSTSPIGGAPAPGHSEPRTWTPRASHGDTAVSPEQVEQEKEEQDVVPEDFPERDEEYVGAAQWAEARSTLRNNKLEEVDEARPSLPECRCVEGPLLFNDDELGDRCARCGRGAGVEKVAA